MGEHACKLQHLLRSRAGCNALSHRVGLLPDKLGKESLPEPTDLTEDFAKSVSAKAAPLCGENFNKRKWEK
jgi:hypothetical protein